MKDAASGIREVTGGPAGPALLAALGLLTVTVGIYFFSAPLVLGAVAVGGTLILALTFPDLATLITLFAVYTNVTVIVVHRYEGVSDLAAGAVVLLLLFPLARHLIARRELLRVDRAFGFMAALLCVMLLSTFGAVDRGLAFREIFVYATEGLLLYLLVLNVVRELPMLRKAVRTLLLAGALLGALTLYQGLTGSYGQTFGGLAARSLEHVDEDTPAAQLRADDEMQLADRARGPVDGPNRFAQILIVLLPLALMEYRNARTPEGRLAATAAGLLILGGVFLTYSRGAFLTLVFLVGLLALLREVPWRVVLLGAGLLAVGVGIVAPGYYERIASVRETVALLDEGERAEVGAVIRGRLTETLAALWTYADHPVLGVGPGQYMPFYSERYQLRPEIDFRHLPEPRRSHNLYAEAAAETGTLGLVAFLAVPGVLLVGLWRQRRRWAGRRPRLARLATAFGLAILAYHGTGMFLHLAYERYYWLLLALAGAALYLLGAKEGQP